MCQVLVMDASIGLDVDKRLCRDAPWADYEVGISVTQVAGFRGNLSMLNIVFLCCSALSACTVVSPKTLSSQLPWHIGCKPVVLFRAP